jgi:hypothetical protein
MPYGKLDRRQMAAVAEVVRGKLVHDIGAGDQRLSTLLVKLGAREVVAIDKEPSGRPPKEVKTVTSTFVAFAAANPQLCVEQGGFLDISFLSWPVNHADLGMSHLVAYSKIVIYLGKCTDGMSCGWPGLFDHFLRRELSVYIPSRQNTLCIYGSKLSVPRAGEYEERAGLDWENIRPYEKDVAAAL